MSQRVALVTGATGAIGAAIARQLAEKGYKVCLLARDRNKGERIKASIETSVPGAELELLHCDLSRRAEVEAVARGFSGPLHVLVNNAAQTPKQRKETPEGIEVQWATNVLGYYWMIQAFSEALAAAAPARVVNVASYWAGGLDLDDPEFKRRRYDNDAAYRQSKQANRMQARGLSTALSARGISVNACHPGDVNSRLSNDLGFGGHESPDQGARTPVWLATSPEVASVTGGYFARCRPETCRFSQDALGVERLLAVCAGY